MTSTFLKKYMSMITAVSTVKVSVRVQPMRDRRQFSTPSAQPKWVRHPSARLKSVWGSSARLKLVRYPQCANQVCLIEANFGLDRLIGADFGLDSLTIAGLGRAPHSGYQPK